MSAVRLSPSAAARMGITVKRTGNKYRARRVNGFDSRKEARRYQELCLLALAKEIHDVRCQPEFHCWVHGALVCIYKADFMWTRPDGTLVVEDVKSPATRQIERYRLKRKLVAALFGITVLES